MREFEGGHDARELHFGIVAARFNEFLTRDLLARTVDTLKSGGASEENIEIFWVPGSFEIPALARVLAGQRRYHALIGLGVILKGGTDHDQLLAQTVAQEISRVSQETGVPVMWGVLSVSSVEEAVTRIQGSVADRGRQFALAAIEMANLMKKISEREGGVSKSSRWPRLFSKT